MRFAVDRKISAWAACLMMGAALSALALKGQSPVKGADSVRGLQEAVIENASRISPPPAGFHFPLGTTFYYKAEWRLFSAGIASVTLEQAPSGQHRVRASADSTGFVARLYHLHDNFQSLFDSRTFCSAELTKRTEEGSRRRESKLEFDYTRHKSIFEELNMKSGEKRHLENDIPPCATDVLSGLFYAGSLPLEPGKTYTFPINDGGKTVDLEARVEAREQIKTDAGTFNALRMQPQPNTELLKKRGNIWIWYSDDADRIPVQMRGRMGWGTLTIRLVRVERPVAQAANK